MIPFHIRGRYQGLAARVLPLLTCLMLAGCGGNPLGGNPLAGIFDPGTPGNVRPAPDDPYAFLIYFAAAGIGFGMLALILSGVPGVGAIVPRRSAVIAIFCGMGCMALYEFVGKLMGPLLWLAFVLAVVGVLAGLYPFAVAWWRRNILKTAAKLEAQADPRAATALRVVAQPRAHKSKTARKNALFLASHGRPPIAPSGGGHAGPGPTPEPR